MYWDGSNKLIELFLFIENIKLKGPARTTERKFNNEIREERNNQRNRPDKPPGGEFHRYVTADFYNCTIIAFNYISLFVL